VRELVLVVVVCGAALVALVAGAARLAPAIRDRLERSRDSYSDPYGDDALPPHDWQGDRDAGS
jgi:hypothetical protein